MLLQDLRHARRMWRAYPLATGAAVLSLAFGMGANTAVFSVLNAALLTVAPVTSPETLSVFYSTTTASPGLHGTSFQNYEDLRRGLPFDIAAVAPISIGFSAEGGQPEELAAELVSDNYFHILGVGATRGRVFAPGEGVADGASPVVLLSDGLWQRRFNRRLDVVGLKVSINARPFTIIGVLPAAFASLDVMRAVDVWIPTSMHRDALTGVQGFYFRQRSSGMFDVVARTPPSLTSAQALAVLEEQARALAGAFPSENKGLRFAIRPLRHARMPPARQELWMRAGGLIAVVAGLVLLIACVNVANLLLARSVARRGEIAVRIALGASRRHLIGQMLVESVMLSFAGALLGVLLATGGLGLLAALRPAFIPPSFRAPIDVTVLLFTSAVAVLTSLIFGLVPALQISRQDVASGLTRGGAARRRASRGDVSRALLVGQSAFATVALVLAALFLRSVQRAQAIDPGFTRDNLAVVSFDLGMLRYDNTQGPAFVRRVNERMAAIPGVSSSAVSSHVILDGAALASKIRLAGQTNAEAISVDAQAVGVDYFRTLDIALLDGRTFRQSDAGDSAFGWAIVNETFARRMWPGRRAIGRQFQVLGITEPYVVIGMVADSQHKSLGEAPQPYFYIFYDQSPGLKKLALFVRTAGDPRALLPAIEREIRAIDPNLPLLSVRTIADVLTRAMWVSRTGSVLLIVFGLLSLTLSAIGVYGVAAFFVLQQWRKIAIRIALGATPAAILFPLMRWTFLPSISGLMLGLVVAGLIGRLTATLLIGIAPTDLPSFAGAAVVLGATAALASALPALGALRLDPARVLRRESW